MTLRNVSRIRAVVISGRLLERAQLDAMLARVKQQFQTQATSQKPQ